MMDTVAQYIGYVVMISGGLALTALALTCALNYLWTRAKSAYGLNELVNAYREKHKAA